MSGRDTGLRSGAVAVLAILLIAPAAALFRLSETMPLVWLITVPLVISGAAFVGHWIDKCQAEKDRWRIPEKTLHLFELLGGWPGAFLAQRVFRHKTSKPGYQIVFWLIVLVHEYAAVDLSLGWKIFHSIKQAVGL